MKDFLSATGMVILFQYINFKYLELFKSSDFNSLPEEEQLVHLEERIVEYRGVNYLGTLFSASLFIHLIAKVIFNLLAKMKMPLDQWTIVDCVTAFFNIVCFNVIGSVTPEQVKDIDQK